jgi:hypothetical protein
VSGTPRLQRVARAVHVALAPVVFLQMLLWLASGLFFSWNNFRRALAEPAARRLAMTAPPLEPARLPREGPVTTPARLLGALEERGVPTAAITQLAHRSVGNRGVWDVSWSDGARASYRDDTAAEFTGVGEAEARAIAAAAAGAGATIRSWGLQEAFDVEYASFHREIPVYRAVVEGGGRELVCFVSPRSGRVLVTLDARQRLNRRMFSWLHVMEYAQSRSGRLWGYGLLFAFGLLMTAVLLSGAGLFWKRPQ